MSDLFLAQRPTETLAYERACIAAAIADNKVRPEIAEGMTVRAERIAAELDRRQQPAGQG